MTQQQKSQIAFDQGYEAFHRGAKLKNPTAKHGTDCPYQEYFYAEIAPGKIVRANPLWHRCWVKGWQAAHDAIHGPLKTEAA